MSIWSLQIGMTKSTPWTCFFSFTERHKPPTIFRKMFHFHVNIFFWCVHSFTDENSMSEKVLPDPRSDIWQYRPPFWTFYRVLWMPTLVSIISFVFEKHVQCSEIDWIWLFSSNLLNWPLTHSRIEVPQLYFDWSNRPHSCTKNLVFFRLIGLFLMTFFIFFRRPYFLFRICFLSRQIDCEKKNSK
jgi:hypothetical protein